MIITRPQPLEKKFFFVYPTKIKICKYYVGNLKKIVNTNFKLHIP